MSISWCWLGALVFGHHTRSSSIMGIHSSWPGVLVSGKGIPATTQASKASARPGCPHQTQKPPLLSCSNQRCPAHSESIMSISLSRPGVSHEESGTQKKHHLCISCCWLGALVFRHHASGSSIMSIHSSWPGVLVSGRGIPATVQASCASALPGCRH